MPKFRASARTVEMLGQQQIAGLPTAISELFKNAHDAYATTVEVDFFRADGLFLLRDDGIGMTKEDFEDRWLVLGTESKVGGTALGLPYKPVGQPTRPVLGEKGIGRLAVAAIGPQVLVLTRARRDDRLDDLVAAFVNWSFFSLPGVHLDDIDVPLRVLPGGTMPDASLVSELIDAALATFAAVEARGVAVPSSVADELAAFADAVDPAALAEALDGPSLLGNGHGTHLLIMPSSETLAADIDAGEAADGAPPLTKFLVGFTNTMTPDHSTPRIQARFRDWRSEEAPVELIADSEFFTPDEFIAADHHITGRFDKFGQFQGTVAIYGREPVQHVVAWLEARGRPVECGPFRLELAVVQGRSGESRLDPELWAQLTHKMDRIGGLYIYREGIRVLPYGNNDYDFLDIELNRSKNFGRYYFSYRRIFGVIELDNTLNNALKEKAGREGFRQNKAYGQFRKILMNFFVQTAADFFRDEGTASNAYREHRAELKKADAARQRRERQRSALRREFQTRLGERLEWLEGARPVRDVAEVLERAETKLTHAAAIAEPEHAAVAFVDAELSARRALSEARDAYRIHPPRGVGLPRQLRQDWDSYRASVQRLDDEVFVPATERLAAMIDSTATALRVSVDRRIRLERGVTQSADAARSRARTEANRLRKSLDAATESTRQLISVALRELDLLAERTVAQSASLELDRLDDTSFERIRRDLEQQVLIALEERIERFQQLGARLDAISAEAADEEPVDVEALAEDELLTLRERVDENLELAQLGTAISVINHEFLGSVRSLRANLRRLKAWADHNEGLARVYRDLRASFDHLDGYLSLFTPLQRRLYRTKVDIFGIDIERFVRELFEERLTRHDVNLDATTQFRDHRLVGYPSTFYPVFVNLVDNAIWWVKERPKREILLQALCGVMSVVDSGPGVPARDDERIFELGFTRKPAGRGAGLYVSRQVLRREGYDLRVRDDDTEGLGGAAFEIVPLIDADEEPA